MHNAWMAPLALMLASMSWAAADPGPDSVAAAPPANVLAKLDGRNARLHVDGVVYQVDRVRVTASGLTFDPERQWTKGHWKHGEKVAPPPLVPPVAWSRIDRVDLPRNGILRGATIGLFAGPLAVLAYPGSHGESEDWSMVYALFFGVPAGILAGGIVGAFTPSWVPVWTAPPRDDSAARDTGR